MTRSRSLSAAAAAAGEVQFVCELTNCTGPTKACFYTTCLEFPPSPPPLPLLVPSDDGEVPVSVANNNHRLLSTFLILAASLLAAAFLLLLLSYFILRHRRRRRRRQEQQQDAHQTPPFDDDGVFDDDDGGPHHIWNIRTVGLEDSIIKSIAAFVCKSGDGLADGGDCSVCLGEFTDGEVVKLLPKCSHAFHLYCIDTWLRSHVNCPLCRAPVVAPATAVEPPVVVDNSGSGRIENTQIEISEPENREECVIAINLDAESSSSSSGPIEPIRRSVSMDSSAIAKLMLRIDTEPEENLGEEKREIMKNRGKRVDYLGRQSVEMKKYLSSRSGRLFFPRYGRGHARSSSVIPL